MKPKSSKFEVSCSNCHYYRFKNSYSSLSSIDMAITHSDQFRDHTVIVFQDGSELHRFVSARMDPMGDKPPY